MQQLPQNVLVLVLGKVWQEERLTTCALVSKAWSEAAAVATDLVCLNYHGIPREGGWDPAVYMPYLQKHGQHVAALSCLDDWELDQKFVIELLPCSNLRELDLEDCAMQLGPSAEGSELQAAKPGLLQGLTALTKLVLTMQRVDDFVHPTAEGLACLTALTVLPALQHFDLSVGESYSAPDYVHGPYDIMPGSVFPGLTNLTLLELKSRLTVDSLEHISWLSKLQELVLHFRFPIPDFEIAAAAAQQPFKQLQQLTYLSLNIPEYQLVSSSSSPAFAGCTALQDLSLVKCCADASVLQGLTKLRSLNLAAFDVLTGGGAGWAAALGHLSCMQALEHLDVSQDVHEVGLAYNNPALGALSASPQLRSLWLSSVDLPPSGWSYLFPRSRVLTGLTTLQLRKMRPGTIMDTDHLRMLVGCCPALHELQVDAPQGFERGVSLLPLLQLPHLVDLTWGDVITRSAVSALSQLTRLERLSISVGPPDLDTCDILQLTALSNLRYLLVQEPGHEDPCCLQCPGQGPPTVWYQLLLDGARAPECQVILEQHLPDIVHQLQSSSFGLTAFELARAEGQTRARVAQAMADLAMAQAQLAQAQLQLGQALSDVAEAGQQLLHQLENEPSSVKQGMLAAITAAAVTQNPSAEGG